MFFGVKTGPNFQHRANVIAMHVIDAEDGGAAWRCTGTGASVLPKSNRS